MSARSLTSSVPAGAAGGPLTTLGWVALAPVALGALAVQWAGDDAQAWRLLAVLLDIVAVVTGVLAVTISLQTLDAREQPRANVLVFGLTVALVANALQAVLTVVSPVASAALVAFFL